MPAQIRIPAKARPAYGSDQHMAIVQPDGTEIDFWGADKGFNNTSADWQTGQTINFWSGNSCGNFYTGSGFFNPSATAGDACLAGGTVRQSELAAGQINHALFLVVNCVSPSVYLYPSGHVGGANCTDGSGLNIPTGARVQLTLTDAQINALGLSLWQTAILHAMHRYGGYIMDTNGGGSRTTDLLKVSMPEDPTPYVWFGVSVPMDTQAVTWGWNGVVISGTSYLRYISTDNWGLDLGAYTIIVDTCYALGTCS